jgi:hypothetical protein
VNIMNIDTAKEKIRAYRKINRPWNIALGIAFGIAAIYTDFYLQPANRAVVQEAIWSLCAVGFLFIAIRRVLRRRQLLLPFFITLMVQGLLVVLARSLFPLENSLLLTLFWAPGILLLGVVFACCARLIDPGGPRPE